MHTSATSLSVHGTGTTQHVLTLRSPYATGCRTQLSSDVSLATLTSPRTSKCYAPNALTPAMCIACSRSLDDGYASNTTIVLNASYRQSVDTALLPKAWTNHRKLRQPCSSVYTRASQKCALNSKIQRKRYWDLANWRLLTTSHLPGLCGQY